MSRFRNTIDDLLHGHCPEDNDHILSRSMKQPTFQVGYRGLASALFSRVKISCVLILSLASASRSCRLAGSLIDEISASVSFGAEVSCKRSSQRQCHSTVNLCVPQLFTPQLFRQRSLYFRDSPNLF